jgi:hypothetical protein
MRSLKYSGAQSIERTKKRFIAVHTEDRLADRAVLAPSVDNPSEPMSFCRVATREVQTGWLIQSNDTQNSLASASQRDNVDCKGPARGVPANVIVCGKVSAHDDRTRELGGPDLREVVEDSMSRLEGFDGPGVNTPCVNDASYINRPAFIAHKIPKR